MADEKKLALHTEGKEQKSNDEQIADSKVLEAAREGVGFLMRPDEGSVAKYIQERWARMDKQVRQIQNELRVNWRRYRGDAFAQIHPSDPDRLYSPTNAKSRTPPTVNKILRTIHRYQAQVTADEPIMEGVPAAHNDESRDAAEAATMALRGEWERMKLTRKLQRVVEVGGVFRSGFWHMEWDPTAGGVVPAQKYFKSELDGKSTLEYVDAEGAKVSSAKEAKKIWQGEATCGVLFPFNVRWSGGNSLEDADEVFVGKIITLGQLYEMHPAAREMKLKHFVGSVTPEQKIWMHEMRGAGGIAERNRGFSDGELEKTGRTVTEKSSILDEPVLLINHYKKPCRSYRRGFHGLIAGDYLVYRGSLRYGKIPVAQFKCLDDLEDPLGLSLVDLLKDPQELLDFVNGQMLRFLQSIKRRWFVPLTSNVTARDLLNRTNSLIHYNANSAPPTPEQTQEIPKSLPEMADRFTREYDDQSGIHDTMQGKHVPGVSSGRHAEALRSGDETILGLTRSMNKEGLETAAEILLAMIQKEWTSERKVRYFGGREYVEKAFSSTDFGDTSKVVLKRGTMLMLTQAQKTETLFNYTEMGILTPEELRYMAPLVDTAGISTSQDPHYIRARRENEDFLAGPPAKLQKARDKYEREMDLLAQDSQFAEEALLRGGDDVEREVMLVQKRVDVRMQTVETKWAHAFGPHQPVMQVWESPPQISGAHFEEHARVLAGKKAENLPEWWREAFATHAMEHLQALTPPPEEGAAPPPPA